MSRDSGGAGPQSPLQTTTLRAYRQAQDVQTAYMSATTVPYSSGAWVLFRSNVDSEVRLGAWRGVGSGRSELGKGHSLRVCLRLYTLIKENHTLHKVLIIIHIISAHILLPLFGYR
jgi:hypothetical protein